MNPSRSLRRWLSLAVLMVPLAAQSADMMNGQRIFTAHCAGCHGMTGIPVMPTAPTFARGERLMQPDVMLLQSIRMGRNAMPGFMGLLSDREILDVISYLRTLQ